MWFHDLRQDIQHAARSLRHNPFFTVVAAMSLAIGLAGTAAIFSIADALFLRPLPTIVAPERLVEVGRTFRAQPFGNISYPNYVDYRERNTIFEELAAYRLISSAFGLRRHDALERVDGARVSGNYFSVLGVNMALGRGFTLDDERPGAAAT